MRFNILLGTLIFSAILFSSKPRLLADIGGSVSVLGSNVNEGEGIRVELKLLKAQRDSIKLEVGIHNVGGSPMWIMTGPIRSDGSKGFYLGISETDQALLELSAKLYYGPIHYDLRTNSAGVKLISLGPGQKKSTTYSIKFPLKETMPPYGDKFERRIIDLTHLKYIRACIGTFTDSNGIREVGKRKYSPYHVNGLESIEIAPQKNAYLFEAQKIVCSTKMELQTASR